MYRNEGARLVRLSILPVPEFGGEEEGEGPGCCGAAAAGTKMRRLAGVSAPQCCRASQSLLLGFIRRPTHRQSGRDRNRRTASSDN